MEEPASTRLMLVAAGLISFGAEGFQRATPIGSAW
jgi:hypothetical protein